MKNYTFKAKFEISDLGPYKKVPNLEDAMITEFVRGYNIYCNKANNGITDKLNEEFSAIFPEYFEQNTKKEWYELDEYNQFMANGYQHEIVDKINKSEDDASLILEYFMDPKEVQFKGRLKADHSKIIEMYLVED